jgi:hypothetical protein
MSDAFCSRFFVFSAFLHFVCSSNLENSQNDFSTSFGNLKEKEATPPYSSERSKSVSCLKSPQKSPTINEKESIPPPIPPLPLNYQRSDGEF